MESQLTILTGILVVATVILMGIIVFSKKLEYTQGKNNFIERAIDFIFEKLMKMLTVLPNGFKELYKVLISQKNIIILGILIIIVLNMNIGTRHIYSIEESYMLGYYERAQGLTYGDSLKNVKNEVQAEFLQTFGSENELAKHMSEEMGANVEYLRMQKENGHKVMCIAPYEYNDAFGAGQKDNHLFIILINLFAIVFISVPLFIYEKKNGMDKLISPTKNRDKWALCKLKTNCIIILVFMLISYGIYYYKLCIIYKIPDMLLPIKSLELFDKIPVNMPLIMWIVINMIGIYLGLVMVSLVISLVTHKSE